MLCQERKLGSLSCHRDDKHDPSGRLAAPLSALDYPCSTTTASQGATKLPVCYRDKVACASSNPTIREFPGETGCQNVAGLQLALEIGH